MEEMTDGLRSEKQVVTLYCARGHEQTVELTGVTVIEAQFFCDLVKSLVNSGTPFVRPGCQICGETIDAFVV
jgi:hypothetical protein